MPDGSMNPNERIAQEQVLSTEKTKGTRQKSGIQFPYVDLDDVIATAGALLRLGGVPCDPDQLAAEMKLSISGSFVNKTSAARMFGLVEKVSGKFQLTQLGHAILDSNNNARVAAAKSEAFLRVPLYHRIYDEFRNNQLPPSPHGLEQAMAEFGVPQRQKEKARRAFENSARQAGFFARGNDRLVAPVTAALHITSPMTATPHVVREPQNEAGMSNAVVPTAQQDSATKSRHPFLNGLFQTLPEPGSKWDVIGQARWLEAAAKIFRLMYETDGEVEVKAKPDQGQKEFDFRSRT